ncbi:MAG: AAA family ATPase [Cyanobium sp.]|nr:AAA family ATPase [Cyanobium sp.]
MSAAAGATGVLAAALAEALPRLCADGETIEPAVVELIAALGLALENGILELDFCSPAPEGLDAGRWPEHYRQALARSPLVAEAGALDGAPEAPLVLVGERLRWRRWHRQLETTLDALIARARTAPAAQHPATAGDDGDLRIAARLDPQQRQAVAAALRHGLLLLSGGPGTGKTSTVVQLLAAHLERHPRLRFQLAAPTGKAAARLREALELGCDALPPPLAGCVLAAPCVTLHRLLESTGERFGRHAGRPLELDLLVVDEMSMVDLPLMAALLEALPADCRLVLVGDPDQLPPVGPGPVLQELMQPGRREQLGPAAVDLRTTYRNAGAIAAVTAALRQAGPISLAALEPRLRQLDPEANLRWLQAPAQQPPAAAVAALAEQQRRLAGLAAALPSDDEARSEAATALLRELERCVLLTPVRQGRWGVEGLHRQLLGEVAARPCGQWPPGTPVLNRRNLPDQGLANGDVGVLVGSGTNRRVLFPGGRQLHPARLGQAEPALALTVHKAQGSQYRTVWLLLPPGRDWDARLLYTGLSRAREQAWLITPG